MVSIENFKMSSDNISERHVAEPLIATSQTIKHKHNYCLKITVGITFTLLVFLGLIGFIITLILIDDEDEVESKAYCCSYEQEMHAYSDLASLCYVVLDTASSETRASTTFLRGNGFH